MNFRRGTRSEEPEINLIPFIDVLLVIVIFLMVTTTYSKFTALQVTLPTADAQKALEQPFEINIAIDASGRYAINNKRVPARDAQGLAEEMQAAVQASGSQRDPVIIINADALATHQTVVNVMEAARLAGYPKLTFAAQSSSK